MRSLLVIVCLGWLAAPALAQDAPQPPPPEENIDASKLGVSLSKIQRGLFVAAARDERKKDGLHLEFNVQVYGQAPKIEVLKGVDLFSGEVPGTAPSHGQMIQYWTPQIYRPQGLPISALAFWAARHFWEKSKKSRCEEEIANYRAMLMQGISVAAPRCTQ